MTSMNLTSRRHFLAAAGMAGAATFAAAGSSAAESAPDSLHLGMMLQGTSLDDLQQQAAHIAGAGFRMVQLTFFFEPSADELKKLAETLLTLGLQVAAFGTYFNLFRPDDVTFMRSSLSTMKRVAEHSGLFGCRQFVTWSASHAPKFASPDPRNHTREAVAGVQRAIRETVLPVLDPVNGRVAFEPFYFHVLGTPELGKEMLAPFPADRVGLVMDPPNFISPELYPEREEEMRRLFRALGDRVHLVHFKDLKLDAAGNRTAPGPGAGEMNYPLFLSELRRLGRPLNCVIEHIKAEPEVMAKTKAWVEAKLRGM